MPETRAHRDLWLPAGNSLLRPRQGVLRATDPAFPSRDWRRRPELDQRERYLEGMQKVQPRPRARGAWNAAKGAIADPAGGPGGWGLQAELAPPGELCSGKLGGFSQALRRRLHLRGNKEVGEMEVTTQKAGAVQAKPRGAGTGVLGWALLALAPSQAGPELPLQSEVGERTWEEEPDGPLDVVVPPQNGDAGGPARPGGRTRWDPCRRGHTSLPGPTFP